MVPIKVQVVHQVAGVVVQQVVVVLNEVVVEVVVIAPSAGECWL